jgi:hypothetical protein
MDDLIASWQGLILIGKSTSEIEGMIERSAKRRGQSPSAFKQMANERAWLIGEPDQCVQKLCKVKDVGINHIILSFSNDTETTPLELFMDEGAPQLR